MDSIESADCFFPPDLVRKPLGKSSQKQFRNSGRPVLYKYAIQGAESSGLKAELSQENLTEL
jgi:hypothetical protein